MENTRRGFIDIKTKDEMSFTLRPLLFTLPDKTRQDFRVRGSHIFSLEIKREAADG